MARLILYQHIGISLITWQLGGLPEELSRQGGQVMLSGPWCPASFSLPKPGCLFIYLFSSKTFTPSLPLPLLYLSFLYICQECSISFFSDCLPTCLSVCLPLAVVLAPIADTLIGIRRSARDLIQKGASAGCLETDLASKALGGIKRSISVLSATSGQIAKELWELGMDDMD